MAEQKAKRNATHGWFSRKRATKLDKIHEHAAYLSGNEMNRRVSIRSMLPSPKKPSASRLGYPTLQRSHSFNQMQYGRNSHKQTKKQSSSTLTLRRVTSAPIFVTIQDSVGSKHSKAMNNKTSNAARKYYEIIVNDDTAYDYKKKVIYNDLVIGNKNALQMNKHSLTNAAEFELKYKIGINSQMIQIAKGSVITVGRFEENDIYTGSDDRAVSRIQLFILVIGDSLIILDGWSIGGTQTVKVNDSETGLKDSMPDKRYVLRYNKSDRIHLKLGEDIDLIINAKECVVCMANARVIRNQCGHYALCQDCYDKILSSPKRECPICRAALNGTVNADSGNLKLYNVQSWCRR